MDATTLRLKISVVPTAIREWFSSEKVVSEIKRINGQFTIAKENQKVIPTLLLRLEIQDLDALYFTGELAHELNLERDKAKTISAEIRRVILLPVKNEFQKYGTDISLLDNFEMPVIKLRSDVVSQTPIIVEEIKKPLVPVFSTAPVSPPTKAISEIKLPVAPKSPLASIPPGPKIISTSPVPAPSTTPPTVKISEPPSQVSSIRYQVSGGSSLSSQTLLVKSQKSEAPGPALSSVERPFILHQESEVAPIKSASGFKLEIPQQESKGIKPDSAIPPRPAQIEIGPTSLDLARDKPPVVSRAEPRIVHYSEARTPLDSARGKPLAPVPPEKISQAPRPPRPISTLIEIKAQPPAASSPAVPVPGKVEGSLSNRPNSSNGSGSQKSIPIPKPPKPPAVSSPTPFTASRVEPPSNLPVMPQPEKNISSPPEIKPAGILSRLTKKVFPAKKFLPDPLKEPELPAG